MLYLSMCMSVCVCVCLRVSFCVCMCVYDCVLMCFNFCAPVYLGCHSVCAVCSCNNFCVGSFAFFSVHACLFVVRAFVVCAHVSM